MDKINKYQIDDIVYSVYVNEFLIININKLKVESFYFNNLPIYNCYIYNCLGLGNEVNRIHEIPLTEIEIECKEINPYGSKCFEYNWKRNPSACSSSSSNEYVLCLEHEIERVTQHQLKQRIEQKKNESK